MCACKSKKLTHMRIGRVVPPLPPKVTRIAQPMQAGLTIVPSLITLGYALCRMLFGEISSVFLSEP